MEVKKSKTAQKRIHFCAVFDFLTSILCISNFYYCAIVHFSQTLIDFLLNLYVINIKICLHNDYNLFFDIVTEKILKS